MAQPGPSLNPPLHPTAKVSERTNKNLPATLLKIFGWITQIICWPNQIIWLKLYLTKNLVAVSKVA